MKIILALLLLPLFVSAQAPLDPVRVSINVSQIDQYNRDLEVALRAELNKLRHVVITDTRPQIEVFTVTAPIEDTGCNGFSAAMVVTTRQGNQISIHTGRNIDYLARHLVAKLEREFFNRNPKPNPKS